MIRGTRSNIVTVRARSLVSTSAGADGVGLARTGAFLGHLVGLWFRYSVGADEAEDVEVRKDDCRWDGCCVLMIMSLSLLGLTR